MVTEHELKTWDPYWTAVDEGRKTFELRNNDRGYQTGDILILKRVTSDYPHYMLDAAGCRCSFAVQQAEVRVRVTYICHGGRWGLDDGWVCMGIVLEEEGA